MNTTTIIGRLAKDPELRFTTGGTAVATFRLAVRNPRDEDSPYWIPVVAYGKVAEAVGAHLAQGDQAAVTGELASSEWTDNDDRRHYKLEVNARTVDFLSRKRVTANGANHDTATTDGNTVTYGDEEPF